MWVLFDQWQAWLYRDGGGWEQVFCWQAALDD
jgi:hypothetical protein